MNSVLREEKSLWWEGSVKQVEFKPEVNEWELWWWEWRIDRKRRCDLCEKWVRNSKNGMRMTEWIREFIPESRSDPLYVTRTMYICMGERATVTRDEDRMKCPVSFHFLMSISCTLILTSCLTDILSVTNDHLSYAKDLPRHLFFSVAAGAYSYGHWDFLYDHSVYHFVNQ